MAHNKKVFIIALTLLLFIFAFVIPVDILPEPIKSKYLKKGNATEIDICNIKLLSSFLDTEMMYNRLIDLGYSKKSARNKITKLDAEEIQKFANNVSTSQLGKGEVNSWIITIAAVLVIGIIIFLAIDREQREG